MKLNKKLTGYLTGVTTTVVLAMPKLMVHADVADVEGRLTQAGNQIQSLLTGLIVMVGIIVSLFIVIKRMPSADDPQEKNEVYKAIGRVLGLVAIGAAIIWIVPWIYSLFV